MEQIQLTPKDNKQPKMFNKEHAERMLKRWPRMWELTDPNFKLQDGVLIATAGGGNTDKAKKQGTDTEKP